MDFLPLSPAAFGAVSAAIGVPLVLALMRKAGRRVMEAPSSSRDLAEPWARLSATGWFHREFVLKVDGREHSVRYDSAGTGEQVFVNKEKVAHAFGVASLVPRIEFPVAGHRGLIEVGSRWLVVIRGFRLSVDGIVLYSEGQVSGSGTRQDPP